MHDSYTLYSVRCSVLGVQCSVLFAIQHIEYTVHISNINVASFTLCSLHSSSHSTETIEYRVRLVFLHFALYSISNRSTHFPLFPPYWMSFCITPTIYPSSYTLYIYTKQLYAHIHPFYSTEHWIWAINIAACMLFQISTRKSTP